MPVTGVQSKSVTCLSHCAPGEGHSIILTLLKMHLKSVVLFKAFVMSFCFCFIESGLSTLS